MAIPLFWRLILGYAAILLLSVGSSVYSIVQLNTLSQTARAAINTDYRMITYQENLTDAFLSEVRYGGKYLITRSPIHHQQFAQFKHDFLRYLQELKSSATTANATTHLVRVEQSHHRYHELFEQELRYLSAGQPYAQSRYQQERDKVLEASLSDLEGLKELLQKHVHEKLAHMENAAQSARGMAMTTTLILLVLGTAISIKISTSVTRPLRELKRRSQGKSFDPDPLLERSPIVEIQELSQALDQEKKQQHAAAQANAEIIERFTEDVASRLISFKKQLNELKPESTTALARQREPLIETLLRDTDRLVQHCAELNASAAAQSEINKLRPQPDRPATSGPIGLEKAAGETKFFFRSIALPLQNTRICEWYGAMLGHLARRLGLPKTPANENDG